MNLDLPPTVKQRQILEVRSWYLIGLTCLVTGLLAAGEYFTFNLPVSGEFRSPVEQQKTAGGTGRSQILSRHSSGEFGTVKEL